MSSSSFNSEKELFQRISLSDAAAFHELFQQHYHTLRFNAFKLLKSEYWAEEVAQEVFVQLWDNRNDLAEIENPVAWLYRITSNRCFDRIRKQEIELRTQYAINQARRSIEPSVQENNHDISFLQQLIKEAVNQLPEQQRSVYIMQQEEELSYKEMAEKLGISRHTVRNHLIRAFQAIRKYIQSQGDFLLLLYCLCYF